MKNVTAQGKPYKRAINGGAAKHPNYSSFAHMKARCYDPKNNRYHSHGARGITVCDRWMESQGFWNFVADMGIRPTSRHTIDRIDNSGDYTPDNCRWATSAQQSANTRRNVKTVGVNWNKNANKWLATIMRNGKKRYLGIYDAYDEAVRVRKQAEQEMDLDA